MTGVSDDELYRQYETVNLYRRGPGAKVELNRPDRMNAWRNQFSLDLLAVIREVSEDPGVRAVLVTARACLFQRRRPEGGPERAAAARSTCTKS